MVRDLGIRGTVCMVKDSGGQGLGRVREAERKGQKAPLRTSALDLSTLGFSHTDCLSSAL